MRIIILLFTILLLLSLSVHAWKSAVKGVVTEPFNKNDDKEHFDGGNYRKKPIPPFGSRMIPSYISLMA